MLRNGYSCITANHVSNIVKVIACITSLSFDLRYHISLSLKWKRTLIKNFIEKISGQSLLELIQMNREIIIASDVSKIKFKPGRA